MARQHRRTRRAAPTGLALLVAACVLGLAGAAQARTEQLRWQHGNPASVAGFTVHLGSSSRSYTQQINAGKPTLQNGAYVFNVIVSDAKDIYVAITATGTNGQVSAPSNERFRPGVQAPPPTNPPPTNPPPAALGTPGKPFVTSP